MLFQPCLPAGTTALLAPCLRKGDDFVRVLEGVTGGDTTITVSLILAIFAVAHSGLASLRPKVRVVIIFAYRLKELLCFRVLLRTATLLRADRFSL